MEEERLEQKLRDYFKSEVKKVEPTPEWWNKAISRLSEHRENSRPEKTTFWKHHPSLIAIPLSIFLLVILVGGLLGSMGGMAPPPPSAPAMVSDEAGGAFLVWLDKPYHQAEAVIRAQHVDTQGNLLWEEDKQIASGNAGMPYAIGDGDGGIIVAWGYSDSIKITRLGPDGNTIWGLEYITSWSVMEMAEDGSGGAILLLYDRIDRISAQRVSAEGVLLWGENGTFLGNTQDIHRGVSLASDGLGGAVIIWQEQSGMYMEIRAQRLSAEGVTLWGDGGIVVTSMARGQGNNRDIISDGMGNFIIAWDTGALIPDTDVYIQKLDENGNPLWGEGGILVCKDQPAETYNPANMQSHPQMAADGTGGVIITWHDRRRIMNREIFAQRISAAGEMLWTENGVWLWDIPADYFMTTSGILDTTIIPDGAGGAAIVWTGYEVSYSKDSVLYAQRLSSDGQRLWSEEKVYGTPSFRSQGYADIVSDGQGGIIIGSRVGESSQASMTDSVYAQRISQDGSRMWGGGGLEIQNVRTALTAQFIAAGAVLAAILVLIGVFRRNKIARIFTAIAPVLIGIAALFSCLLLIGPLGYSYNWAYILNTPVNVVAVAVIPIAGLIIGAVGIMKGTVTRWIMVPVVVFCSIVTVLCALPIVSYLM